MKILDKLREVLFPRQRRENTVDVPTEVGNGTVSGVAAGRQGGAAQGVPAEEEKVDGMCWIGAVPDL
jgi:hypothetical protein